MPSVLYILALFEKNVIFLELVRHGALSSYRGLHE